MSIKEVSMLHISASKYAGWRAVAAGAELVQVTVLCCRRLCLLSTQLTGLTAPSRRARALGLLLGVPKTSIILKKIIHIHCLFCLWNHWVSLRLQLYHEARRSLSLINNLSSVWVTCLSSVTSWRGKCNESAPKISKYNLNNKCVSVKTSLCCR